MIRLLILDDNVDFCWLLTKHFSRQELPAFTVVSVQRVAEAYGVVKEAADPFDVFLIDLRLTGKLDGIEVMQRLRALSPMTDGVIMTSSPNPNTTLRAYRAGASRYLAKPFSSLDEIVLTVQSVCEKRRAQDETKWLKILTEIAQETLHSRVLHEVAEVVVQGALRLGFERARLWLLDESGEVLLGASQAGSEALTEFTSFQMPVSETVYSQKTLKSHDLFFYHGLEFGPGYFQRHYEAKGFHAPEGEWVEIPLWGRERCLGMLVLDNANRPTNIREAQRDFLRLFAKQVGSALERVFTFEQELRERRELEVINQIGRHIAERAARDDLQTLLEEIRQQIGTLIDVQNFRVILLNKEAERLDYWLEYENGQRQAFRWHDIREHRLINHLISNNEALFAPQGTANYRQRYDIPIKGPASNSWISVPLSLEGRAIGMFVLDHNDKLHAYEKEDLRLLKLIASQVAAVIYIAQSKQTDQSTKQQLDVLHRASEIILRLAEQKESWMWHATLTAATAGYALGFDRAFLFLLSEDAHDLRWELGIGHFNYAAAQKDWEEDERIGLDFGGYLTRLRSGELNSSPLEKAAREGWTLSLAEAGTLFHSVLSTAEPFIIPERDVSKQMPAQFIERFGKTTYAIVPLRAGAKTLGLLVVDNIFSRAPILPQPLDYLDSFLDQAALTYEILKQQQLRDRLIDLNYNVLAEMPHRPLKAVLSQICQAAQEVTQADCVMIYALILNRESYEIDNDCIAAVGLQTELNVQTKPRQKGITGHILRTGQLVIGDVNAYPDRFDGQRLANHPFLKREKIAAFVGVRVEDATSEDWYGLLYLNYRTPQAFSPQIRHYAQSFASLAAVAIRNTRSYESELFRRRDAEAGKRQLEKELILLQFVSQEALTPQADEPKLIKALLNAAEDLLNIPHIKTEVVRRDWQRLTGVRYEPQEIRRYYSIDDNGELNIRQKTGLYQDIIGEVLRSGKTKLVEDVRLTKWKGYYEQQPIRSKLLLVIHSDAETVGVLRVTSPYPNAFTSEHQQVLERLVGVGSLALDNVRRQEHLYSVLRATKAVSNPQNLTPTLQAISDAVFDAAPGLSALTIWYKEPEDEQLKLGASPGMRNEAILRDLPSAEMAVIREIMNANPNEGFWVEDVVELHNAFIEDEQIESAAAFPLYANNEHVGAMFFYYRRRHDFTDEEKGLFPILAAIVAASILDAARLELVRSERSRFQAATAITEKVGISLDLDETLRKVITVLRDQLFPNTHICVMTYNIEEQALVFTSVSRDFYKIDNPEYTGLSRVLLDGGSIACHVARQSLALKEVQVANISNVKEDQDYMPLIRNTQSEICISLMGAENKLLGVLVLESPIANRFNAEDQALLIHVGRKISLAMARAYQSAELQFQTTVAAATSWAAEIAHDLDSEIGHVLNRLAWLKEDEDITEIGLSYIVEIEESLSRLDRPLASVSALQSERPEEVPINQWIHRTVLSIISDKNRTENTSVTFKQGCADITMNVRQSALRSAMCYIVHNALDELEGQSTGHLIISTKSLNNYDKIEVQIEDSGQGVDEAIRDTLFQQPKTTKGQQGHGFGLIFARHLIQQMGGTLQSLPPTSLSGACFAFTLPINKKNQGNQDNGRHTPSGEWARGRNG